MGAAASSEQKPTTRVFLPKTPTEFTPALISKLDSSLEVSLYSSI